MNESGFCIYCDSHWGPDESGCAPNVCWNSACGMELRPAFTLAEATVKILELTAELERALERIADLESTARAEQERKSTYG